MDCKFSALFAISTMSSAYIIIGIFVSPIAIPRSRLRLLASFTKSFAKVENSVGERFQPCFTPLLQLNQSAILLLIRTLDVEQL